MTSDEKRTAQAGRSLKEQRRAQVQSLAASAKGWFLLTFIVASVSLAVWFAGHEEPEATIEPSVSATPSTARKPTQLVTPERGAYTGAYIDFGETEDNVTLEGIEAFEEQVGKHQAIVAFSSFWGEQTFPKEAVNVVARHGSAPLIFWSPWDRPYSEELVMKNGPDKFRLDHILAGQWNEYIDRWADAARDFGQPMFVSLCNEMNGNWFPWSGEFYGGGKVIPGSDPPRYQGPEMCKRAYRYIVDRVRARGAKNILWVLHLNNFSEPMVPANSFAQYYPGPEYVDWLGISVYGQQFPSGKWDDFDSMAKLPYDELCQLDPDKPVMLTEWGVGEFPDKGDKAGWFADAFSDMQQIYPRLHAAIYWHERWQNAATPAIVSLYYSDLRVNSSERSLKAYRRGLESSFWLGEPIYR